LLFTVACRGTRRQTGLPSPTAEWSRQTTQSLTAKPKLWLKDSTRPSGPTNTTRHLKIRCSTFSVISRPPYSAYTLGTAVCEPTCTALVCHTRLTALVKQVPKPQNMSCSLAPFSKKHGHSTGQTEPP
jgi:hypothetical protein